MFCPLGRQYFQKRGSMYYPFFKSDFFLIFHEKSVKNLKMTANDVNNILQKIN